MFARCCGWFSACPPAPPGHGFQLRLGLLGSPYPSKCLRLPVRCVQVPEGGREGKRLLVSQSREKCGAGAMVTSTRLQRKTGLGPQPLCVLGLGARFGAFTILLVPGVGCSDRTHALAECPQAPALDRATGAGTRSPLLHPRLGTKAEKTGTATVAPLNAPCPRPASSPGVTSSPGTSPRSCPWAAHAPGGPRRERGSWQLCLLLSASPSRYLSVTFVLGQLSG